MNDDPVFRRGDVLWRRTPDRVILLVPSSGEFVTLQSTGCDLWAALAEPSSMGELVRRLAAVYGAPVERVAADVAPILDELARRGVVAVSRGQ